MERHMRRMAYLDKRQGELDRRAEAIADAQAEQLKVLKEVVLVVDRQEGTRRVYRVDPAGLAPVRAYLDRFWKQAVVAFAEYAEEQADPPSSTESKEKDR